MIPAPLASVPPPSETGIPGQAKFQFDPGNAPSLDHLITEDGKPVDNPFVAKEYRLLTEPLHSSWAGPGKGRKFWAEANVGLFFEPKNPAFCPDAMLAVDIEMGDDLKLKENQSYYVWLRGKVPDVVIEIVSDRRGGEETHKMRAYARMGIPYYVIFDPRSILKKGVLRVFGLRERTHEPMDKAWFPSVELGLRLWRGTFEDCDDEWLRWCDRDGIVIPTGKEKAEQQGKRTSREKKRASVEKKRAEQEAQKAELLRTQLRALGIDPSV